MQRHEDFCEFEASLVYRTSSKTGSKATDKPCLQKKKGKEKEMKKKNDLVLWD